MCAINFGLKWCIFLLNFDSRVRAYLKRVKIASVVRFYDIMQGTGAKIAFAWAACRAVSVMQIR